MIPEILVLLTVQHFQHSGGGIAVSIRAHLVDLVQKDQRIAGACLYHSVYDTTGHSADVGLSVAADICLIPDTAQGYAYVIAAHSAGDGSRQGRLTDAGRADEAENLILQIRCQLTYGDVFQNTILDLGQSVVIRIQNFLGGSHVYPIPGQLCPRNFQTSIQIGSKNGCFGGTEGGFVQTSYFLEQFFAHFRRRIGTVNFGVVFLHLIAGIAVQLRLDYLHLLPQIVVPLVFVDLLANLLMDLCLHLQNFGFFVQKNGHLFQPLQRIKYFQNGLFVLGAHQYVGRDQIRQKTGILHGPSGQKNLVRRTGDVLHHSLQSRQCLPHQGLGLYVPAGGFVQRDGFCHKLRIEVSVCHIIGQSAGTANTFSDHTDVTVGGLQCLTDLADGTHRVQILCLRGFDADIFLSNEKYMSAGVRSEVAGRNRNFTG